MLPGVAIDVLEALAHVIRVGHELDHTVGGVIGDVGGLGQFIDAH